MNLKKLLQEQGEYYKNLISNKTVQTYNEKINPYGISKQEYKAIIELENLLGMEAFIVDRPKLFPHHTFEIFIQNNQIVYLRITNKNLEQIPKQINKLTNLQELYLNNNKITKIENLDKLQNLGNLVIFNNEIKETKGLENLTNLQNLDLDCNKITKIEGLDKLQNLKYIRLHPNPIENKGEIENLRKRGVEVVWL